MITTTLNDIRRELPCEDGWCKLLRHLGKTQADDEPLPLLAVLDSNGLEDTIWCLRTLGPEHDAWVRLMMGDLLRLVTTDDLDSLLDERNVRADARDAWDSAWDIWAADWDADPGDAAEDVKAEQERILRRYIE